jgi:hypothetical protein
MKALDMIMKDDGCGFGDKIGCCPKCGEPFSVPIEIAFKKRDLKEYPCRYCGQLVKIK